VDSTFKKIDYEKFIAVYTGRDKPSARVHYCPVKVDKSVFEIIEI